MKSIVFSVGGSIMLPEGREKEYLDGLVSLFRKLSKDYKIYCVTGGGRTARYYIAKGRELGANESYLDELGIAVTRINARVLIAALKVGVNHVPAKDYDEAIKAGMHHSFVVMGGVASGYTTDAVAAILAERVEAEKLVIMTSVDGVYSDDPRKVKDAKKFDRLNPGQLLDITARGRMIAGSTNVIDPVAALIIARSAIRTVVVHGDDLESVENAVLGKEFKGTLVQG